MSYYTELKTLHIVFAGMWLIFFAADIVIKQQIENSLSHELKNKLISLYLKFTNLFGIVGSIGIAFTGIIIVLISSNYGFFDMSSDHWLATKQILFVIILLNTFIRIIPISKKLRTSLESGTSEEIERQFTLIKKINLLINILVILNFIFAITHRMYS